MTTNANDREFDKATWGDGPWQHEPDRVEFEHARLPCLMVRSPHGAWCGYTAVLPGHPWHGRDWGAGPDDVVNVHGGLTYSGACSGHICHVPKPGEPDNVWWFGFDCNHSGDYAPGMEAKMRGWGLGEPPALFGACGYRDLDYVKKETEALAEQLAEITG